MHQLNLEQLYLIQPPICQILYKKLNRDVVATVPFKLVFDENNHPQYISTLYEKIGLFEIYRSLLKDFPNGHVHIVTADPTEMTAPVDVQRLIWQYTVANDIDRHIFTVNKVPDDAKMDCLVLYDEIMDEKYELKIKRAKLDNMYYHYDYNINDIVIKEVICDQ